MESSAQFQPLVSQQGELILGLFAFAAITYLGLMVYLRNPRSATHRLFAVVAGLVDAYIIVNYLSLHPPLQTPENQLFWIRVVMFTTSFIGPMLFLLVHTFPRDTITLRQKYLAPLLILMFASAVLSMTPLVFQRLEYVNGEPLPTPGLGMPVFVLDFGGLFFWSIIWLIHKYRKASGREKVQIQYFLIGIAITFAVMGIASNLTVVLGKTSAFVFLGPLMPVILMAFVAFSIVKHRFLDIQPIIARAVSYLMLTIVLGFLYTGALFALVAVVEHRMLDRELAAVSVLVATIAALTFQPLRARVQKFTDRLLFKGQYDSDALLQRLTRSMVETIDLERLAKSMLATLTDEMRIGKGAFLILEKHRVVEVLGAGYSMEDFRGTPLDELVHANATKEKNAIAFEEVSDERARDVLRALGIALLIPIRVHGEEVAVLALGTKRAGDLYSAKDLSLLTIFASESGIAIQNAKLYRDLKKSDEMKSQFISVVSHQMRTPISAIRWNLELLRQKELAPEKRREFLANAYHNSLYIAAQLDDVLTALAIQNEQLIIQKAACDAHAFSMDALSGFEHQIRDKHLEVKLELGSGGRALYCDAKKIQKVIQVLVYNAITYTPANGTITIHSEERAILGVKHFVLSVTDTGIGLTDEEKSRMFDKFFRGEQARLIAPDGMGLGMFIADTFVKEHGGQFFVESGGRGKGATFTFALPIEPHA